MERLYEFGDSSNFVAPLTKWELDRVARGFI